MNKYFGKVVDDKIIFNREAFFKLTEEIKEDGIKLGKKEAQAEIARLREALKFYANCGIDHEPEKHIYNYGNTAREALKGGE
jgi:hypothetical protein